MPKGIKGFQKGHKHSNATKQRIGDALRKSIEFKCIYCDKKSLSPPSHYKKKKNHFCSILCYANFRLEFGIPEEHSKRHISIKTNC